MALFSAQCSSCSHFSFFCIESVWRSLKIWSRWRLWEWSYGFQESFSAFIIWYWLFLFDLATMGKYARGISNISRHWKDMIKLNRSFITKLIFLLRDKSCTILALLPFSFSLSYFSFVSFQFLIFSGTKEIRGKFGVKISLICRRMRRI